ncbi:MAG TPA: SDR family oxidoreductase [Sporichthyaceae bacterium]|jgi:NAD(P)-dependent dehydrogenase (short-subunit alcohol dehydrogenase family)|nr:SDR family oxidoreductase [Sporichthyaceae bacterium]
MTTVDQRVAVITGASQGIGAALVEAYRKRGWAVVANSRSIQASGDADILAVPGDIADPATARNVIDNAVREFGRVDTLVNNAGIFIAKPFTDYTAEEYQALIAVNLTGFFTTTQLAIAQMLRQGDGGLVVQVTTSLVDNASSMVPSVLASLTKGGLQSATKSLAIEFARRGVRVNAVAPGIIQTPMHSPENFEVMAGMHPIGRMGMISDIVDGVLYLQDAPFVTGEILHVDGGQSAGR